MEFVCRGKMLLKIKDLQKGYMEGLVERKVLDGCALEVAEGEFVVVTGESGSGKSTLLNLISGIDKADGGQIWFGGELVSKMKDQKLSELRRDKIGIVFQFFNLLPGLSAQENVMLSLLFKGISYKDASERAQFLLNEVGLLGKEGSLPDELSGGEMQRVSIARALSTEPKLILADEPTGNLDIENSLLVLDIFEKMVSLHKSAVILVTHDEKIYKRGGVSRYKLSCGSLY